MKTILFQGDSITDACRSRENPNFRGNGYATLVSAALGFERPMAFHFVNRGISGNRVIDLIARVKPDFIQEKPDYISLLIGVNDVWHDFYERPNGISAARFEGYYDMLLNEIKESLPAVRFMILEPFALKGPANEERYESDFRPEVEKRAAASRRIAEKHNAVFVPLQEKFDKAAAECGDPTYWLFDGVHPSAMGHELIKREWLRAFAELEK